MSFIIALLVTVLRVTWEILNFYSYLVIAGMILSWLVAFNVVNSRSRFVQMMGDFLYRITEPVLRPIRRAIPPMGGMDLSPLALLFLVWGTQYFISLSIQILLKEIL